MTIRDDFLVALAQAQRVNQLPDGSDKAMAEATTAMFDFGVGFFRDHGNEPLKDLAQRLWTAVNQRVVQVAIWPGVPTMHFVVVQNNKMTVAVQVEATTRDVPGPMHRIAGLQALILLPIDWLKRVERDCVNELGAIVYTGAQAVDYALGRVVGRSEECKQRAMAYESEYLHMVRRGDEQHNFNAYQREVMSRFPLGLASFTENHAS